MIRSLSTRALGQPSETKEIFGAGVGHARFEGEDGAALVDLEFMRLLGTRGAVWQVRDDWSAGEPARRGQQETRPRRSAGVSFGCSPCSLPFDQGALARDAPAVAGERTIGSHDMMARDRQRGGVRRSKRIPMACATFCGARPQLPVTRPRRAKCRHRGSSLPPLGGTKFAGEIACLQFATRRLPPQ